MTKDEIRTIISEHGRLLAYVNNALISMVGETCDEGFELVGENHIKMSWTEYFHGDREYYTITMPIDILCSPTLEADARTWYKEYLEAERKRKEEADTKRREELSDRLKKEERKEYERLKKKFEKE